MSVSNNAETTISRRGVDMTTSSAIRGGRNYVGKTQKVLCVKTKNGKESLCVRMNNNGGGRELQVHERFCTVVGRVEKSLCE